MATAPVSLSLTFQLLLGSVPLSLPCVFGLPGSSPISAWFSQPARSSVHRPFMKFSPAQPFRGYHLFLASSASSDTECWGLGTGDAHGVEDGWSGASWPKSKWSEGGVLRMSPEVVRSLAMRWEGRDGGRTSEARSHRGSRRGERPPCALWMVCRPE